MLDGLQALIDNSMLRRVDLHKEPRVVMLETAREFALEQLEVSGELEALRERHGAYYTTLAREADLRLEGAEDLEQAIWLDRLEAEHGNLREAFLWSSSAHSDAAWGTRLAGEL